MIFPYCVKIDGVYYPANTEIRPAVTAPVAPPAEAETVEAIDFEEMTIKELKSYAKANDINIKGLTAKDDILKAVKGE